MPDMFSIPFTLEIIDSKVRPPSMPDEARLINAEIGTAHGVDKKHEVLWLTYTTSSDESFAEWADSI